VEGCMFEECDIVRSSMPRQLGMKRTSDIYEPFPS
jgi:hypothetical protein